MPTEAGRYVEVCAGAGGHTGFLSPFAFVSAVREFFDGYVITGGGIGDGWGVAGAMASGADLVYMGTRFIPTAESLAPPDYKQMVVDSSIDDLVVSAGVTGTAASWLKPSLRAQGLDPDNMPDAPGRQYDSNQSFAGKKWTEVWAAGQNAYLEVSSCTNFEDFQSRRMNLRYKAEDGKNRFCHTLNGSGTALARLYVAILESGQQPDGSVNLPPALHSYFGAEKISK